ncbi:hypothetical protein BX661DRAFT_183800 [Kickxella alabastrina]|uniref:uncharacterized protein n=1 Tax=Kickxella alabastrina TaxID=61397 RepID=UPI00221FC814|nr:uncharacterized protein BX661DRAFT_183800 [Kickxella alabastrina]KAI7826331.1 hypothetical protein BX661DRAFT_183800 [Kickxella alabastrina]
MLSTTKTIETQAVVRCNTTFPTLSTLPRLFFSNIFNIFTLFYAFSYYFLYTTLVFLHNKYTYHHQMKAYWRHDPIKDKGRVGFTDPSIWSTAKEIMGIHAKILVLMCVVTWAALSLYFGATYKRSEPAISDALMAMPHTKSLPTWRLKTDIANIEQARDYTIKDAWGVVVINKGLSASLANALQTGADYDASAAITLLVQSGHHPVAQPLLIQPAMSQIIDKVAKQVAVQQVSKYQQASGNRSNATNTQALLRPIGWTTEKLAPFDSMLAITMVPMGMFAMFTGVIELVLTLKFNIFTVYKTVKHSHIYLIIYLVLLYGALAFLAYKGPTYDTVPLGLPITGGRFFSLWMCYAITLIPTGLWAMNLIVLIPPALIAFPTVLTVTPSWFQAVPFYQGGMLARYIISGAHPSLGQNLGILFGETVLMLALLFITTRLTRKTQPVVQYYPPSADNESLLSSQSELIQRDNAVDKRA